MPEAVIMPAEQARKPATAAPTVSVIMPAYNVARYIGEALDSVLAQTFTGYEIIVVNDGSPDTEEFERALEPYREHIIYITQQNRGPSSARNVAIRHARGEYVALLDSDDVWLPDYLAEQMEVLRADPTVDLIYADSLLFGDSDLVGKTFMQTVPSRGPVTFESLLGLECTVHTSCTVAKRQSLIDAGLFDERFIRSEDFDLWVRLAHRGGRITYQQKVIARHRMHSVSLAANVAGLLESQIEVYEKFLNTLPVSQTARRIIDQQIKRSRAGLALESGKQALMAGHYDQAVALFKSASNYHSSLKLRAVILGLRFAPGLLQYVYRLRRPDSTNRITISVSR
ncbi:MAG: glycosyltransferase family 2 protein [Pyrinomonadaceae bacterium]|nr:glycosyltransferase family 2 protein [Pyrinomonadaceae bacterium]